MNTLMMKENNDRVLARVTRLGGEQNVERRCWFLKVENDDGSVFGGCSCGVPNTDGIPCHHMIAVVKSGRIDGLTPTNAMPFWWTTECCSNTLKMLRLHVTLTSPRSDVLQRTGHLDIAPRTVDQARQDALRMRSE